MIMALLVTFLLGSCTAVPYWVLSKKPCSPADVVTVRVTQEELAQLCQYKSDTGCVINGCIVVLGPKANKCTEDHEDWHTKGWTHDKRKVYVADCGPTLKEQQHGKKD